MSDRAPECEHLILDQQASLVVVTLNRPESFNTLSVETLDELQKVFLWVDRQTDLPLVILTGHGGEAFAAGADIRELASLNGLTAIAYAQRGQRVCRAIERGRSLVIAAIDGYCMGGGLDLALSCHLRMASPRSVFSHPGGRIGIMTGFGGTARLPRAVGRHRAVEIFLSGKRLSADEARSVGLIHRVIPEEALLEAAKQCGLNCIRSRLVNRSRADV